MRPPPASARSHRGAPALRFLAFCLGGWTLLRVMILWNPAVPMPPGAGPAPKLPPLPFAAADPAAFPAPPAARGARVAGGERRTPVERPAARPMIAPPVPGAAAPSVGGGFGSDRHSLRYALIARLFPASATAAATPAAGTPWTGSPMAMRAEPGRAQSFWMQRSLAGWSLGGWLYMREGSADARGGLSAGSQLGGSQAGLRLAYGFGESGRLRAYGRATAAVQQPQQRELALGMTFAPVARWPVDIAVEQRLAIGREGRTAVAAMVTGGVDDVRLPGGFRLDAYGQAGIVGARRRDGFADGAVAVDRRLGADERGPLRLGAFAAGAIQPGAARVDVGPRLTVNLPDIGKGGRLALDWRQRVAGDVRPDSGLALTLATDF